jgi:large subunit ribosomal protein L22
MTKVIAKAKWVKSSPNKIRRIINVVKKLKPMSALDHLKFMPHKSARIIEKVIMSAIANAKNNFQLEPAKLKISELYVDTGTIMRRIQPRARGRAFPIKKKTSHVTVILEEANSGSKSKS